MSMGPLSMSLVFTLASRNLFHDRVRFAVALIGIILSVVLVTVQIGLYFGFSRMVTIMIDHAAADLWIAPKGVRYFEDLPVLSAGLQSRLLEIDGVAKAVPVVAGYSAWKNPDGPMIPIFVVGSDFSAGGLYPWNVVEGSVDKVATPEIVAIDRVYFSRLGVKNIGASTRVHGHPATVGAITNGIRSLTMMPYVFSDLDTARTYIGLAPDLVSYFLVHVTPSANIEAVRKNIISNLSSIAKVQVLTSDQFREQSRSFWLFETGAGVALVAGAVLAVIVGTAIVALTLYSSTKDHLYEFATMRAMGATSRYIYTVIIYQALLNALIGFTVAAIIGIMLVHFTANTALQIVITDSVLLEILLLTIAMCVASALAAILRVVRIDPVVVLSR
jgi:putative ABC transport system permease protein